ncbi:MAG TPA: archaetidylserine decarboxylase [Vicinamibacteria bacterium]
MSSLLARVLASDRLNFVLTNRVPRRSLTRLMGWYSRIESPLLCRASLAVWRRLAPDLDLSEARETRFASLHDCFVRELKEGARPVDPHPARVVSPCDGVVVAGGRIRGTELIQAKGLKYSLEDLLLDPELVRIYTNGRYLTLRLRATMYHRFHAPHDCRVEQVTYVPGDTWNVNPPALRRVPRLYARNERAILRLRLRGSGHLLTLVPVAAILVASIRLHFLDLRLQLGYRGPHVIPCQAALRKGEEMGWFEHGSTMIVFAPPGLELCDAVREHAVVRAGQPLLRLA